MIVTVATDGASMYASERELALAKVLPGRLRRGRGRGGLRRAPARGDDRPPARADVRGARADLQPRLLHLGRAAGRLDRGLPGPTRSGLLDGDAAGRPALGRADRRAQRSHRGAGGAMSRLVCAGCGAEARDPYAFRCPNADARGDVDHVLRRELGGGRVPARRCASRTRSSATGGCCTRGTLGLPDGAFVDLVRRLDERVAEVDGHGFRRDAVRPGGRALRPARLLGATAASSSRTRPATSPARTRRGTCSGCCCTWRSARRSG